MPPARSKRNFPAQPRRVVNALQHPLQVAGLVNRRSGGRAGQDAVDKVRNFQFKALTGAWIQLIVAEITVPFAVDGQRVQRDAALCTVKLSILKSLFFGKSSKIQN